jgi:hypothetical protein
VSDGGAVYVFFLAAEKDMGGRLVGRKSNCHSVARHERTLQKQTRLILTP